MSEPAEIYVRVTRLEEKMADVHNLASRTDREVASWRGVLKNHTTVLNAMNERLERFEEKVDDRFDKVDERFDRLEAKVNDGFTMLKLSHAAIIARLDVAMGRPDDGPIDE